MNPQDSQLQHSNVTTIMAVEGASTWDIAMWLAKEVQSGIWAVFLVTIVLAVITRQKVSRALDHHLAMMKSLTEVVDTNAEVLKQDSSNLQTALDSQKALVTVLEAMEAANKAQEQMLVEIKDALAKLQSLPKP